MQSTMKDTSRFYSTHASAFLELLEKYRILKWIRRMSAFSDEPRYYLYSAALRIGKQYTDGLIIKDPTASGVSFTSEAEAIFKCLAESIERFCLYSYKNKASKFSSYKSLSENALDPALLNNDYSLREKKLRWIKGFDLISNTPCLIPTQLLYINYQKKKDEIMLPQPMISTGAAGGFDYESTLLRGIYEVVERDSFMTIYLNKIMAPMLDLKSIKSKTIQSTLDSCERYKLELYVFDVTTDLQIPTFLSIALDRTGIGPYISCGAKASLNAEKAILGSLSEVFLTRPWIRSEIFKNKMNPPHVQPKKIRTFLERGFYWWSPKKLKYLDFLFNQKASRYSFSPIKFGLKDELSKVTQIFTNKGTRTFYADITHHIFQNLGYRVYKVVIPSLQPIYFNESQPVIRLARIKTVSKFFHQKNYTINTIPHPFL